VTATPNEDAVRVEVVAHVTWQDDRFLASLKHFHAECTLVATVFEEVGVEGAFVQSQFTHFTPLGLHLNLELPPRLLLLKLLSGLVLRVQ